MSYWFAHAEVNQNYFTNNIAVGGSGGKTFYFNKLGEGAELKAIKAWKKPYAIRCVEIWMTDGTNFSAGRRKGESLEFSFERGERITQLKVQASTHEGGTRCGAIMFQTNRYSSCENLVQGTEYRPDVGSGLCYGIFGTAGADIDRLGFAMQK